MCIFEYRLISSKRSCLSKNHVLNSKQPLFSSNPLAKKPVPGPSENLSSSLQSYLVLGRGCLVGLTVGFVVEFLVGLSIGSSAGLLLRMWLLDKQALQKRHSPLKDHLYPVEFTQKVITQTAKTRRK